MTFLSGLWDKLLSAQPPKLGNTSNFNPFTDKNIAFMIEAGTMRADEFPYREMVAFLDSHLPEVLRRALPKMCDDLIVPVHHGCMRSQS